MNQKRIPARRSRPARSAAARPAGAALYRPKRVRAGGTPTKPRKQRAAKQAKPAAEPKPTKAKMMATPTAIGLGTLENHVHRCFFLPDRA